MYQMDHPSFVVERHVNNMSVLVVEIPWPYNHVGQLLTGRFVFKFGEA